MEVFADAENGRAAAAAADDDDDDAYDDDGREVTPPRVASVGGRPAKNQNRKHLVKCACVGGRQTL